MRIQKCTTLIDRNVNRPYVVGEDSVDWDGTVDNAHDVVEMIESMYHASRQTEEHMWLVALDTKLSPCGVFEISHGSVNMSIANPREVYVKALLAGAANIILVHNHPSGDCTPSSTDDKTTTDIGSAGMVLGVNLLDHIVVGEGTFFSYRESGRIK